MPLDSFPVAFVTSSFGVCNLKHYLDQIRGMSRRELAALRSEIINHARTVKPQQAFSNTPGLTTHQALLKAIAHERLRRLAFLGFWRVILPLRQFVVARFSGIDLENNEYFGAIYVHRNSPKTVLHLNHRDLASYIGGFLVRNWFSVATLVVAIAAIVVTWFKP